MDRSWLGWFLASKPERCLGQLPVGVSLPHLVLCSADVDEFRSFLLTLPSAEFHKDVVVRRQSVCSLSEAPSD